MSTPLLVATGNSHKTEEIKAILGSSFEIEDLRGKTFPKVEETGTSFLENATLKAVEISKLTGGLVLSDDSGLEVDALDGAPGVYSARYAGVDGDNAANNAKLVAELNKLPADAARSARFRCVIVLARGGQRIAHFSGTAEGSITTDAAGSEGFGYDPLFIPEGYSKTFAELPAEVKNTHSHRGQALSQLKAWLDQHPELSSN